MKEAIQVKIKTIHHLAQHNTIATTGPQTKWLFKTCSNFQVDHVGGKALGTTGVDNAVMVNSQTSAEPTISPRFLLLFSIN